MNFVLAQRSFLALVFPAGLTYCSRALGTFLGWIKNIYLEEEKWNVEQVVRSVYPLVSELQLDASLLLGASVPIPQPPS